MASLLLKVLHAHNTLKHLIALAKTNHQHSVGSEVLKQYMKKVFLNTVKAQSLSLHAHLAIVSKTVMNTLFTSRCMCVSCPALGLVLCLVVVNSV